MIKNKKKILVTGAAGFIGFHLINRLLLDEVEIVGIDNLNEYYDVRLKYARLKEFGIDTNMIDNGLTNSLKYPSLGFLKLNLENKEAINDLFAAKQFDIVINLAAQAGVRHSLKDPDSYIRSNIVGFLNILEACRYNNIKHLVYASSSSVYGLNETIPFSANDNVDHPISIYAASKKSNELMAHVYSHLFGLPTTGLRFFTAYGPWGRPDMAYFSFTEAILNNKEIDIFNNGDMLRDFTYIDDIVDGINSVINNPPVNDPDWDPINIDASRAPYKIYNIGNSKPVRLLDFITALEMKLNKKAIKRFSPMQPGDVYATYADVTPLQNDVDYNPKTNLEYGIGKFVDWYRQYYQLKDLTS